MRKVISYVVAFAMTAVMVATPMNTIVRGDKIDDLKKQKQEQEQKQKNLEKKASDTKNYINEIDAKITDVSTQLGKTTTNLNNTQEQIKVTKKKLDEAQESVKSQYSDMKLRIKYMYENGDTQMLDLILNSKSITEFLNKAEYITELSQYDRNMLNKFKKTRQTIADSKKKLEKDEKNLLALQKKQQTAKANLETLSDSKKGELSSYQDQIQMAKNSAASIDKEIAAQQEAVAKALEAEKKRQEEERKKQEQQKQQQAAANNSNKTSSNTTSNTTGNTSSDNKQTSGSGSWGWPLPGHHTVSSGYGPRDGGYHNGIDIPAPAGTPIVAAASGTVAWANYSSSAGNWVGITHSNGATSVYMHMSSSCVSAGQSVSAGQTIGYVGNTGASAGNHLHFGVKLGGITGSWANPWSYLG